MINNKTENSENRNNSNDTKIMTKTRRKKQPSDISYEQEVLRKGIHLMSLSIPIIYIFLTREFALTILIPLTIIFVSVDILAKKNYWVRDKLHFFFGGMLRDHEKDYEKFVLNGASWVLISAVVTLFIFPKVIAVIAFMILIVSDISAALIGRKYGFHKIVSLNKSVEGTLAFMASGFIVVWLVGMIYKADLWFYTAGYLGAFVGGFAELFAGKMKLDDNLSIPISVGLTMSLINLISYHYFQTTFLNLFNMVKF